MKRLILILSVIFVFGCKSTERAQRRLNRLIDNYPELAQVDTIHDTTTVIIPEVRTDTLLSIDSLKDTVYIEKDRLKIKTVIKDNNIYIEGECESDTIEVIKEIPVERIIYKEPTWWQRNRWWVITLGLGGLYVYARKKIPFLP